MRLFLFFLFLICHGTTVLGQSAVPISGYVKSARSGELLIGATIEVVGAFIKVSSNNYGYFVLEVPPSSKMLRVGYLGYEDKFVEIDSIKGNRLNIELIPLDNLLEEVIVSGKKENTNASSPQMGVLAFTMEEVKNIPVVFGEKDILKTIQLLPGVGKGGEGSSSFYVRGGGGDQNLILLDEATVYNASHLMGFFSTFNSDAIKEMELFKGGIPAQYGGRISSGIDIHMMDGNNKRFVAEGGVGLIASRLKLEAPIVKDKSSFMVSGRRTYADLFLKLSSDETVNQSKLYFYDLNAKMNYRFDDKNTLYLSG